MIELVNVSKSYKPKKGPAVQALKNVSLKIEDKGLVFILGKSGSGKSTLLNVMGGLDSYDDGEIIVKNKSSKDFSQSDFDSYRNTFIGFIFQEYNILNEFTVGQNIALAIQLQGKKATSEIINKILDEVDLKDYANRKPNELSGGQKQRVAIARALIKNPEIIMADEPTGALDSNTGKMVFDTLKKLSKNKLVVVVSHDRDFAEQYGDRVIELADGVIISDIYKYEVSPEEKHEGINIIDDKIIHIKDGYELTVEDLVLINNYIKKAGNVETIISLDGRTNEEVKRFARIDDEGNMEAFKDTTDESLDIKQYDPAEFKLIKSKLPFKKAFRIGVSGLKNKPIRLFFTILLSAVAFAAFGITFTAADYDKVETTVAAIQDTNVEYVAISKVQMVDYGSGYAYPNPVNMNADDVDALKKRFPNISFSPLYYGTTSYPIIGFEANVDDSSKLKPKGTNNYTSYYDTTISGFAELTAEQVEANGYTMLGGRLPAADDEIAVTNYVYEVFKYGGYNAYNNNTKIDITSPGDLIGKSLNLTIEYSSVKEFKIVGIIDTHFDNSPYAEFLPTGVTSNESFRLGNSLQNVLKYSLIKAGIVNAGYIDKLLEGDSYGISGTSYSINFSNSKNENLGGDVTYKTLNTSQMVKRSSVNASGITFIDPTKTTLNKNEILISLSAYKSWLSSNWYMNGDRAESLPFSNDFNDKCWQLQQNYINDADVRLAYETAGLTMDNSGGTYGDWTPDTGSLIQDYLWSFGKGYYVNEFATETNGLKSGYELELQFVKEAAAYAAERNPDDTVPMSVFMKYDDFYDEGKDARHELTIVGIYLPDDTSPEQRYGGGPVCLADEMIDDLGLGKVAKIGCIIGNMPVERAAIKDLVAYTYDDGIEDINYSLQNTVTSSLEMPNTMIEDYREIFLYVALGCAVFAGFLLMTFISTSISYKKAEIGILRAVGARSADVVNIFLNESFVITFINYILSLAMSIVAIFYLNGLLSKAISFQGKLLQFGFLEGLYMILIAVGVAALSTCLPVWLAAKKKPIDAIRGR